MNWKKYFPIIGIILFIYILIKLDLFEILAEIKNANLFFLLIALFFVLIMLFMETFKWFTLAVFQNIRIPFIEAFKINLISNFYGFVTPSKIGNIIRADYLKKYTGNIGKGLCNFTLDKILDTASIIFIAILFSFVFKDKLELPVSFFVVLFLVFVFLTVFFIKKKRAKFVLKIFFKRFVPKKMKEKAKLNFDSFYDDMPKKRYFILFFFLNLMNWIILYTSTYFIGLAFGINLPFIYFLAILPIGTLIALIPISVNGLGTREATLITLFGLFGIPATKVFSMSVLALLISGILPALLASFLIWRKRLG